MVAKHKLTLQKRISFDPVLATVPRSCKGGSLHSPTDFSPLLCVWHRLSAFPLRKEIEKQMKIDINRWIWRARKSAAESKEEDRWAVDFSDAPDSDSEYWTVQKPLRLLDSNRMLRWERVRIELSRWFSHCWNDF